MAPKTLDEHIKRTPGIAGGKPRIGGHRIEVSDVAIWHERLGMGADEIASEYDLTLAQVYAALAYCFARREEIDRDIAEGLALADEIRRRTPSKIRFEIRRAAVGERLYRLGAAEEKMVGQVRCVRHVDHWAVVHVRDRAAGGSRAAQKQQPSVNTASDMSSVPSSLQSPMRNTSGARISTRVPAPDQPGHPPRRGPGCRKKQLIERLLDVGERLWSAEASLGDAPRPSDPWRPLGLDGLDPGASSQALEGVPGEWQSRASPGPPLVPPG